LTLDDFVALGLLSEEEIREGADISRVVSVEDTDAPTAASTTTYDDALGPDGTRTEFALAAGDDDTKKVVQELALEAKIYNSQPSKTPTLWQFMTFRFNSATETPGERYFSLTGSSRVRDGRFNTRTSQIISLTAKQDPEDSSRFIVDFAQENGNKMYFGRWQAERYGGYLGTLRNMQSVIADKMEQVRSAPDVSVKQVDLPLQP